MLSIKVNTYQILKVSLLVLFSGVTFLVNAQDWKNDVTKLQSKYDANVSYQAEMIQRVYYDGTLAHEVNSSITYSKAKYHSKIDQYEVVSDAEYLLTIDHLNKTIILGNAVYTKSKGIALDIATLNVEKVSTSNNGSKRVHRFLFKEGDYEWMEMEFDSVTFEMKRMRYKNRYLFQDEEDNLKEVETEIIYQTLKINPVLNTIEFKTDLIVLFNKQKKTWGTTSKYATYELNVILQSK